MIRRSRRSRPHCHRAISAARNATVADAGSGRRSASVIIHDASVLCSRGGCFNLAAIMERDRDGTCSTSGTTLHRPTGPSKRELNRVAGQPPEREGSGKPPRPYVHYFVIRVILFPDRHSQGTKSPILRLDPGWYPDCLLAAKGVAWPSGASYCTACTARSRFPGRGLLPRKVVT
jgi:hypothetical protein